MREGARRMCGERRGFGPAQCLRHLPRRAGRRPSNRTRPPVAAPATALCVAAPVAAPATERGRLSPQRLGNIFRAEADADDPGMDFGQNNVKHVTCTLLFYKERTFPGRGRGLARHIRKSPSVDPRSKSSYRTSGSGPGPASRPC